MVNSIGYIRFQLDSMKHTGYYSYDLLFRMFEKEIMHPEHNEFFESKPYKERFDWLYHMRTDTEPEPEPEPDQPLFISFEEQFGHSLRFNAGL